MDHHFGEEILISWIINTKPESPPLSVVGNLCLIHCRVKEEREEPYFVKLQPIQALVPKPLHS